MILHVIPENDLKPHSEETICKCCPSVQFENGEMIVVHNSFDGRENYEKIKRLPLGTPSRWEEKAAERRRRRGSEL